MDYTSSYDRINWQNTPSVSTPINASNLNKMDSTIKALDTAMGDVSTFTKSNRVFTLPTQSAVSNKITVYIGDDSVGAVNDLLVLAVSVTATTSSSWSLQLTSPTPGGVTKTYALKKADGSTAYADDVDANTVMLVTITSSSTANVVGVFNAADIDFPLAVNKGGTGNIYGLVQAGHESAAAIGLKATAEGGSNEVTGDYAHAEGTNNTASGNYSHVEGNSNIASGSQSHAEGFATRASKGCAHAEGANTVASGDYSHAGGLHTVADYMAQTAIGKYNNNKSVNLFEVGNGADNSNRSNAFEVNDAGDATASGQLKGNTVVDGAGNDLALLGELGLSVDSEGYIIQTLEEEN